MKNLTPSQVHYVKAVYELSSGCESGARIVDIAEKLEVSKASASLSMTKLAKHGFVYKDSDRHIYLTENGEREAIRMLDKFNIIRKFLTKILNINDEVAVHDACGMEHIISMDTLCAICRFSRNMGSNTPCPARCPATSEKQACSSDI
jgi:DtxR family Mn-dependent transcriptional regulator